MVFLSPTLQAHTSKGRVSPPFKDWENAPKRERDLRRDSASSYHVRAAFLQSLMQSSVCFPDNTTWIAEAFLLEKGFLENPLLNRIKFYVSML